MSSWSLAELCNQISNASPLAKKARPNAGEVNPSVADCGSGLEPVQAFDVPLARTTVESPGDSIRIRQLEAMQGLAASHGYATPLSPLTLQLYWTLYLGVFSFWAADESPHQEDTLALLDQSVKLFVASLSAEPKGDQRHGREIK